MHAGMGATPYPPGLGLWFSTPAQGQCLDGASIGDNGCTFRVLPRATVAYGQQFVQRGFRKGQDGKEVEGQSVVPEEVGKHALCWPGCVLLSCSHSSIAYVQVLFANAQAFSDSFGALNTAKRCCGC